MKLSDSFNLKKCPRFGRLALSERLTHSFFIYSGEFPRVRNLRLDTSVGPLILFVAMWYPHGGNRRAVLKGVTISSTDNAHSKNMGELLYGIWNVEYGIWV